MLEFQAVLMAGGPGSRLPHVTGSPPKCLLPVGPFPLVWYPLNLLQHQGFQEVILVVLDSEKAEIQAAIERCDLKLKIDYQEIPSDEDWGTADSLRHIQDRIITDIVVMSCDFISDTNLDEVLNLFRKHDASAVSLLFNNGPQEYIQVPGPKTKQSAERDLIGIDEETQRLVFLASASDFEESVDIARNLIKKHPVFHMKSRLLDSHVYVFKKWVIDYLVQEKHFTTVKGELLPHIVKKQLSKPSVEDSKAAEHDDTLKSDDIFKFANQDLNFEEKIRSVSTYNDHHTGMKGCYHDDAVRCYAHSSPTDSYAIRVNTLSAYCLINQKFFKVWDAISRGHPLTRLHPKSEVKTNQIDEECIVGEQSVISEKTSIRKTMMGMNCTVENKVRLMDCILMNNVSIKEGCVLQNCIIYSDVTIQPYCNLKSCIVGPQFIVNTKTEGEQQIYSKTEEE